MIDLDGLVQRARDADVRRDVAEDYVRELDRWARRAPPPRRWLPWAGLAFGLAAAAAAVVLVLVRGPAPAAAEAVAVRIGDRVAIVADPGTAYRVVRAGDDDTQIEVERGAVTARLWPGARAHHLTLAGGGVVATAHGTVYSLSVTAAGGAVHVDEGTVEVKTGDAVRAVPAGASWPANAPAARPPAARALLALPAPPPPPAPAPTPIAEDAPPAPDDAPPAPPLPPRPGSAAPDAPPLPIKERWHRARLLRGQAHFAEAVAECLAIADARDATWSPIALVEAVRIYAGPLADPEHAIATADRAIREWPADALVPEARALRCHALAQLGRGAECAPPDAPPAP